MRIVGGKYKGKKFYPPNNLPIRPTTDYAKESLFNILNNHFDFGKLNILDCFSGSGNISFEFLSRGVKCVHSIDSNYNCISYQKKIKKELNLSNFNPLQKDVFKTLKSKPDRYDIIFSDPPYDLKNIDELPELVFSNNLLNPKGWLIIEHAKHTLFEHIYFKQKRKYGTVNFSFFYI